MKKVRDPKLDKIVEILKTEFKPTRLFLFGSRANGSARVNSDYDFVMVVSQYKKNSLDDMSRARSLLLNKLNVSADIFIYTEHEFLLWEKEFSSIPETAVNTGQEIEI